MWGLGGGGGGVKDPELAEIRTRHKLLPILLFVINKEKVV